MAHDGTLGHFLPYLLRRRLRAVLWPDAGEGRAGLLFLGLFCVLYGAGLAYMLNHHELQAGGYLRKLLFGLNGIMFLSALLVDFVPTYRLVQRPLPDHFPVSGNLNVVMAFLLDLITVRRIMILVFLLVALAGAPHAWRTLGLIVLVVLSAGTASFNLRLLLTMRRWQHPLLFLNLLCLLAAAGWLSTLIKVPVATTALATVAVLGPFVLWVGALRWLGEEFTQRNLAAPAESQSEGALLARLSPEWKAYFRKTWPALAMAVVFKTLMLVACGFMAAKGKKDTMAGLFYMCYLPIIGFTYVNNNLFGHLYSLSANELTRVGLTSRLLRLYLRLVVPVLVLDCSISAVLLLLLFSQERWPLLGLLPLAGGAGLALGLWGSLYKAKAIYKNIDFANMRTNASTLINGLTLIVGAALYLMPWWWARIALAMVVMLSAWWPVQRVLRNEGGLRRQLWVALKA